MIDGIVRHLLIACTVLIVLFRAVNDAFGSTINNIEQ